MSHFLDRLKPGKQHRLALRLRPEPRHEFSQTHAALKLQDDSGMYPPRVQ